ncbi:Hypothetical protein NTJ_07456 [Nesidiocoris tenuis]|uniref:MADF domain-containing protein n=1 Tax=Nesidiocoris tenuis TaxID=355587 RepID=A0ABN7AR10_9HEMI|nr:Hypothetical protein NTJ_07456 [Nesidiocoris tenuis]
MSSSDLIASVYRRRALWDPSDVHHHNRLIVNSLWQDVGRELSMNMMQAKSKWRGLRDYYRQQRRRNIDQPVEAQFSSWAHFAEMSFLEGTMTPRSGRAIKGETSETPIELNRDEGVDQGWTNGSQEPTDAIPSYNLVPQVRYADSIESSDPDDDDLHFFKSLLPDVKSLPRHKKLLIRLKIQELIINEIYPSKDECGSQQKRKNLSDSVT